MTQELPEGTVTILFTDIVGSTELRTGRGDASAQEILRAHFDLVRQQIERHSGQEVKTIGDSFMVAFGSARRPSTAQWACSGRFRNTDARAATPPCRYGLA